MELVDDVLLANKKADLIVYEVHFLKSFIR